MTLTRAQTHTHEDFANPYLVCGQCGQPATGYHDQIQCGCDTGYRLLPCRHTAEASSICLSWSPVDGCTCTNGHHPTRTESGMQRDWHDDGHTASIILAEGALEARITCPHDGTDVTGRPLDELPRCRVGYDADTEYGHRFALDRCLLTATAENFQQDELWEDNEEVMPITSLPIALLWRDGIPGEVYITPKGDC